MILNYLTYYIKIVVKNFTYLDHIWSCHLVSLFQLLDQCIKSTEKIIFKIVSFNQEKWLHCFYISHLFFSCFMFI